MSKATTRPLDIVDVKAGIRAGRLFVQIRDNKLLLGDHQTGEAVTLSDIEVKAVIHAKWIPSSVDPADPYFRCSNCHHGRDSIYFKGDEYNFCPHCGAQMDGES